MTTCAECGHDMFVTPAGIAQHGSSDEVHWDADADHVAIDEDNYYHAP